MNSGGDVLAFFNDELTTFRNKNARFICNVKKNENWLYAV